MDNPIITVSKLNKTFKVPHEKTNSLKAKAVNVFARKSFSKHQVLKNIDFEIKKGEFFGIVGKNGCGKSTLLKIIANIYQPSSGSISINGTIAPFLELGVGFNPELTGRENVFLSGIILGMSRKKIESLYDEIVDFAELSEFMDQKLKNYSSGMQVRLAFSIAVRAESDILLIDEVLAVGDAAFQKKCFDYFQKIKESDTTVCFVTHDMGSVLQFCDRALFIDKGEIAGIGRPEKISELYQLENLAIRKKSLSDSVVKKISVRQNNKPVDYIDANHLAELKIETKKIKKQNFNLGVQIFNEKNIYCFGTNTKSSGFGPFNLEKAGITFRFKPQLVKGNYYINVTLVDDKNVVLEQHQQAAIFRIKADSDVEGVVSLDHQWEVN